MSAELEFVQEMINEAKNENLFDVSKLSDGYHTFAELYEHRIALFIALCSVCESKNNPDGKTDWEVWRSKLLHSDGSSFDGWFVLGLNKKQNEQITYYLPMSKWNETEFAETLERAPEFDGHTSNDVLNRLKIL